ncbi:MAG: outer membrane beta-barrel protein [Pseudomonadales bacterium]|nr:outer membrane beta-barrel protein [Pseudomonadales bacterium]MCP5215513.1 outer membrane beta-barrel protein [Pseudomonadales bacterium]
MKYLFVIFCLASFNASALDWDVQLSGGFTTIDDIKIKPFTLVETGTVNASLEYDDTFSYGIAVGMSGFEQHNVLRLALSWQGLDADFDSADLVSTGGTELPAVNGSASSGELKAAGLDFDNSINIYTVELHYLFPTSGSWVPYFGAGGGIADIENADQETVFNFLIGLDYKIGDSSRLGIKAQRFFIDEITDDLGIEYDSFDVDMFSLVWTYSF